MNKTYSNRKQNDNQNSTRRAVTAGCSVRLLIALATLLAGGYTTPTWARSTTDTPAFNPKSAPKVNWTTRSDRGALDHARAIATKTPRQAAYLEASDQARRVLVEKLGEEGAATIAKTHEHRIILAPTDRALSQGLDLVAEARDGKLIVYEAKGGTSQLSHSYGYRQGTVGWAVKSAENVLHSTQASAVERETAKRVIQAAQAKNLEVWVIRTEHVLGEPGRSVVEQISPSTARSSQLAKQVWAKVARVADHAEEAGAAVAKTANMAGAPTASAKGIPRATGGTQSGAKVASKAARAGGIVAKAAPVVAVGVEVVRRGNDVVETERAYEAGEISSEERCERHGSNIGGAVGGAAGAWGGAKAGAAVGGAIGSLAGPVGTAVGGFVGAVADAIGGGIAGDAVGEAVGREVGARIGR